MPVTAAEIEKSVGPDAVKNFETKQVATSAAESVLAGRRRKTRKTRKNRRKTSRRHR